MKKYIHTLLVSIALVLTFSCCNTSNDRNSGTTTIKMYANDPFRSTMAPTQKFNIDGKQDNVVEGEKGTILVFPKGCFVDQDGKTVEDGIKIELSEALSLTDMILSNLTTMSNGKPLITDGMIYFNATKDGKQLRVNKDNPVHIEIPTKKKQPGMMAWKGTRDSAENMNWTDPKAIDNYLVTVDINQLDFLPEHFEDAVQSGMPYKNHKTADKAITDSLFYLMSVTDGSDLVKGFAGTNYNEAYYNDNKQVENGKYTKDSYKQGTDNVSDSSLHDTTSTQKGVPTCGVDPASVKVIRSDKYQHTLIATREFEKRMKAIYRSCDQSILEIYIKNLDRNLYELDSMAARICGEREGIERKGKTGEYHWGHSYEEFQDFARQRLTKVREADKYAILLQGYYDKQLAKVRAEMDAAKEKMITSLNKKNEEAQKLADEYCELLFRRETYRMEAYGFNWTETGWVNIDTGTAEKSWSPAPLEAIVDNGKNYDRTYTYVVYQSIKSLYRLNTDDNVNFYVGNNTSKEMLMPKNSQAIMFAIGYKGDSCAIAVKEFNTTTDRRISLTLQAASMTKVKETIMKYEQGYVDENLISVDLEYMRKFYAEDRRQKALMKEKEFFCLLWSIVHPCCPTNCGEVSFK